MASGILMRLRRTRRVTTGWVVAALILPLLLGLLPQPAMSAAAILDRDLALSLCAATGSTPAEKSAPANQHGQCVLCITGCSICGAKDRPAASAIPEDCRAAQQFPASVWDGRLPVHPIFSDARPPRGPPPSV